MRLSCTGTVASWAGWLMNRSEQATWAQDPWISLLGSGTLCQNGVLHPSSASVHKEDSNLLMQTAAPLAQWQNLSVGSKALNSADDLHVF